MQSRATRDAAANGAVTKGPVTSGEVLLDDLGAVSVETKGVEQEWSLEALETPNARD